MTSELSSIRTVRIPGQFSTIVGLLRAIETSIASQKRDEQHRLAGIDPPTTGPTYKFVVEQSNMFSCEAKNIIRYWAVGMDRNVTVNGGAMQYIANWRFVARRTSVIIVVADSDVDTDQAGMN